MINSNDVDSCYIIDGLLCFRILSSHTEVHFGLRRRACHFRRRVKATFPITRLSTLLTVLIQRRKTRSQTLSVGRLLPTVQATLAMNRWKPLRRRCRISAEARTELKRKSQKYLVETWTAKLTSSKLRCTRRAYPLFVYLS